jgi:hypothetical protein
MHTRLKLFFGSLLSLSAVACQAPVSTGSAIPSSRLGDAPNLIKPDQSKLPEKLRQAILKRNGDPNLVKLDTLKNLKEKGFPGKEAKQYLNPHFGIAQSFPQVSCQSGSICSYENIGDFDVFYNAIYGDYYESYNNGLCAYDQYFYCTQDPDNPDCLKSINELKFYGCACPDGYTQTDKGCSRQLEFKLSYFFNDYESQIPATERAVFSPAIKGNNLDYIYYQIIHDGINPWQLDILNSNNEIVFSESGSRAADSSWGGYNTDGEFLADGLYTMRLTSGEVVINRNIEINNKPQLKLFHTNIPPDAPAPPVGEIIISPADQDGRFDTLGISVLATTNQAWQLEIHNSDNALIWQQSGSGFNPLISWEGRDEQDQFLPNGLYTVTLIINGESLKTTFRIGNNLELYVVDGNIPSNEVPFPDGIIISPANRDNRFDWADFKISGDPNANWRLQVLDLGGSTVWFKNGIGDLLEHWYGTNQVGELLPEGSYIVHLTSGDIELQSPPLKISQEEHSSQVDVYMPEYAQQLLDNAEKRMRVMQRDVDILMQETLSDFPNTAPFHAQSIPDVAGFRIQQQQVDPPPPDLSAYSVPKQGEHPKAHLDAQNDSIVTDVALMRQKVTWLKQVNQQALTQYEQGIANFTIQQTPAEETLPDLDTVSRLSERLKETEQIEQSFYGITTTQGCYSYYNYKGTWKKKKLNPEPSIDLISTYIDAEGGVMVYGRVNDPPDNFDYQRLIPYFMNDINVIHYSLVNKDANYFKIIVDKYDFSPDFKIRLENELESGKLIGEMPKVQIIISDFSIQNTSNGLKSKLTEIKENNFPPIPGIEVNSSAYVWNLYSRFAMTDPNAIILTYLTKPVKRIFSSKPTDFFVNINYDKNLGYDSFTRDEVVSGQFTGNVQPYDGRIRIGNFAFYNRDELTATIAHELFHRHQWLVGDSFKIIKSGLEIQAYNYTILNANILGIGKQLIAEEKAKINDYGGKNFDSSKIVKNDNYCIASKPYRSSTDPIYHCND